jgi:hypothetical protein
MPIIPVFIWGAEVEGLQFWDSSGYRVTGQLNYIETLPQKRKKKQKTTKNVW